jgi:hypothetical protein
MNTLGYVGFKNNIPGTIQICKRCADNKGGVIEEGHTFSPVEEIEANHYIITGGGMTCDYCRIRFI